MKAMPVSLTPDPLPQTGEGSVWCLEGDYYVGGESHADEP